MRWRRLDVPGREDARVERTASGWRLTGELDVEEAGVAARLHYVIECDTEWRTRSAAIEGQASGVPVRFALGADGEGNWTRDGAPVPELAGALDVDLGFTPATNTLPIRRLSLAVGESAPVRSAWLRFPELRLETLEQTYTRESEQSFRYRALVDGEPFVARLDTDAYGRVLQYEGLWEAEPVALGEGPVDPAPAASPELLLVRHGRSAHVQSGWIDIHGVRRWMEAYDAAEILAEHAPPPELEALTVTASRIITSDLPRTVASAKRLAAGRDIERSMLLREAPLETPELPMPALGGIRLPLRGWGMIFGARFLSAWIRGAPPPGVDRAALMRAEEAADLLITRAMEANGRIVVVTHATFRTLVGRALTRRGWQGPKRRPFREWSAWPFIPGAGPK